MTKQILISGFIFFLCPVCTSLYAQNTRISDNNTIGWFSLNNAFKVSPKISFSAELYWRRVKLISEGQANMFKGIINYQIHPKLQLRLGYGLIENIAYGEYPLNSFGKGFTENRLFEAAIFTDKVSKIDISHRFMLEQRWQGKYSSANLDKQDSHVYGSRFRYMLRCQMPLIHNSIIDHTPYIAAFDELLIGFGKNVNENVFDQNRLGLVLGYKFNNTFRIEGGYFCQIAQLAREINGRNVFQHNKGFIINMFLNFDLSKKENS
ncbi:MAG: DUF2490 domain-containing protein [Saprospiraceae bacterium]